MSEFQPQLNALVAKELTGDAERLGALIEALTDRLGLAIAVSCNGDVSQSDTMLTGVEGYLAESIANHAKLARFMALAGYRKGEGHD